MRGVLAGIVVMLGGLTLAPAAQAAVTIGPPTRTVPESGMVSFTLSRSSAAVPAPPITGSATATVRFGRAGDTAGCPADVTVTPADPECDVTVEVPAPAPIGSGAATATVAVVADVLHEGDESITATLTQVTGDTVGMPASAVASITDDDPVPTITIGSASAPEGTGSAASPLDVPVTLSGRSAKAVGVGYDISAGSASAQDVSLASGTLTIPAGEATGSIPLRLVADALDEDDETVTVTLRDPAGATLGSASAAVQTIADDDAAQLSVADVVATEGTGATGFFSFTVSLSTPSAKTVGVRFTTADASATAPADYTATTGTISFPPGETRRSFRVGIVGDAAPETGEFFLVRLEQPVGAGIGRGSAFAGILDDDGRPPTAAGAATPGATSPGGAVGKPAGGADVTAPKARLSRLVLRRPSLLRSTLTCPAAETSCRATVTVFTVPAPRGRVKRLRRELQLARRTFTVRGGERRTVSLRIPATFVKLLRQAKRTEVQGFAVIRDAAGNVGTAQARGILRP